jgi:putative ABC transport system permease protein
VRQAIGARRREILVQFLIEAAVLTSVGGILGVLMGSAIGLLVNLVSAFRSRCHGGRSPWPRILGGNRHLFGMLPAWRASRLDPIEALRYDNGSREANVFVSGSVFRPVHGSMLAPFGRL